ncbi:unnamed protein product [Mytilus edulis]|uniref:C1q domain-containing protein n=1 Tax=Mytilus edulis TaxID=6550 RepID=A0A8S3TAL1_MYTED|nr:unnamed protein product [Mytilus edulis]
MNGSQDPDKNSTKLNQVLKDYIIKTVEEATDQRVPYKKMLSSKIFEMVKTGQIHERPAFSSSFSQDDWPERNEIIIFDHVWLNIGNGYDATTGVFTVPRNGLYSVTGTLMSVDGKNLHCHLWKNNEVLIGLFGHDYSSGTLNSAMLLKKGDTIYIKHDNKAGEQVQNGPSEVTSINDHHSYQLRSINNLVTGIRHKLHSRGFSFGQSAHAFSSSFDTTKLNHVLKDFIIQTVNEATDQRIPIIKTAVIEDIGYEPGRIHERPAFTASLTTTKPIHSNEVVKFDKVWLNMGNAYNPITGVFTAPINGLYFVSSTVRATHSAYLHCRLWKNNQPTLSLFGTNYSTGTINMVMPLKKGDIIYIKHDERVGETILGAHYSMFSAYLINE